MGRASIEQSIGNLPIELNSFVGRRREASEIKRLLSLARLITLVGTGGVGKTRLALHVGVDLRRSVRDGVWMVDFSAVRDPDLVLQVLSACLGMQSRSQPASVKALTTYLSTQELILILDNCEHLLDACAVIANELLRSCPRLRIIATSRQPLGVTGEHTVAIPSLALPSVEEPAESPSQLAAVEAVALLLDRACAVIPGFQISDQNAYAVVELCRQLDGNPLALELAAAKLRVLSPHQLLDRLQERFSLLNSGSRSAMPRQRSLQALVDWSYDLCSDEERLLWARLAVFAGGCDIDAVEDVCSGEGLARKSVLGALTGLVDKSIVVAEPVGTGVRYRLQETIRQYGLDRTTSDEARADLRRRHRDHYLRVAGRTWSDWFGPAQTRLTFGLRLDLANFREALESSLAQSEASSDALAFAVTLTSYGMVTGQVGDGQRSLAQAVDALTEDTEHRARAYWLMGWVAILQGKLDDAESLVQESLAISLRLGDKPDEALAHELLGELATHQGDLRSAARLYQAAAAEFSDLGYEWGEVIAGLGLGITAALAGDTVTAIDHFRVGIARCEGAGESWTKADALWQLSMVLCQVGDLADAYDAARTSLRIRAAFDNRLGIAQCLDVLAWIATQEGDLSKAARLLGKVEQLRRGIDVPTTSLIANPHEKSRAWAENGLGEVEFVALAREGCELPLSTVIARALGESVGADSAAVVGEASPLTIREREVADLVAAGKSNREIAGLLTISLRTAEGHVEHILVKLGFRSRAQIAAWVTGRNKD